MENAGENFQRRGLTRKNTLLIAVFGLIVGMSIVEVRISIDKHAKLDSTSESIDAANKKREELLRQNELLENQLRMLQEALPEPEPEHEEPPSEMDFDMNRDCTPVLRVIDGVPKAVRAICPG